MVLELPQTTRQTRRQISRLSRPTAAVYLASDDGTALDKTRDRLAMLRSRIFLRGLDDVAGMDELLAGLGPFPSIPLDVQRALRPMVKLEIDFETVGWTVELMLHRVPFPFLPIAFECCLLVLFFSDKLGLKSVVFLLSSILVRFSSDPILNCTDRSELFRWNNAATLPAINTTLRPLRYVPLVAERKDRDRKGEGFPPVFRIHTGVQECL